MKFIQFLLFNCFFFLSLCSLKILLIGDSIDRYILHDWCYSSNSLFCRAIDENGWIWKPTNCTSISSYPNDIYKYMKYTMRVYSWTISVCDNLDQNITLGFLFNMQGVSPNSPWFNQEKSHFGLYEYHDNSTKTVKDAFNHFQKEAFPILNTIMGGIPDAISINSYLWDTARLLSYGGLNTCNITSLRHQWIKSWAKNASELIDVIKETSPQTKWFGWRMAHQIMDNNPPCRNKMFEEMNVLAEKFVKVKNTHLEPWLANHPFVNLEMRDKIHPGPIANIAHMNSLIKQIKKDLNLT